MIGLAIGDNRRASYAADGAARPCRRSQSSTKPAKLSLLSSTIMAWLLPRTPMEDRSIQATSHPALIRASRQRSTAGREWIQKECWSR